MKNLLIALSFCAALMTPACKDGTVTVPPVVSDIVSCTDATVQADITQWGPLVKALIKACTNPDGSITWTSVETGLANLAIGDAWCVVSDVFGQLDTPAVGSGSGSAVEMKLAVDPYKAEFAKLRTEHHLPATFKTAHGNW